MVSVGAADDSGCGIVILGFPSLSNLVVVADHDLRLSTTNFLSVNLWFNPFLTRVLKPALGVEAVRQALQTHGRDVIEALFDIGF